MVKVSTTVFKVLVFEKPALFLIFSDYGHICFWNYTQQLHTTAFAVTGCWCSSSNVFFQLPCWPCVHSSANIPRQKVHHVFSHGFFFNSLVTNFPIVTVAWALQNFWNNQLHWTLDANYHWLNHIPLEWEMNFQTRFTWLQTERLLCKQQEGIALWRPVPAADTVITLCQESFLNWQKVDNSSSLKQNVSGTLYVILHRQQPGLWKPLNHIILNSLVIVTWYGDWDWKQILLSWWEREIMATTAPANILITPWLLFTPSTTSP